MTYLKKDIVFGSILDLKLYKLTLLGATLKAMHPTKICNENITVRKDVLEIVMLKASFYDDELVLQNVVRYRTVPVRY